MLPPVLFLLQIPQMQIHRILADPKDLRSPAYCIFHVVDAFLIKSLDDLLVSVGGRDVFFLNDLASDLLCHVLQKFHAAGGKILFAVFVLLLWFQATCYKITDVL